MRGVSKDNKEEKWLAKRKAKTRKIMKVVYFDEIAASDYIDIENGGKFDWTSEENKAKIAEMMVKINAQAKAGFDIFSALKAALQGDAGANYNSNATDLIKSTLKNTILTDYIALASDDEDIKKFAPDGVHALENSISMYKMFSSYMNIVPKEVLPLDMEKFNEALLGERGYYEMLLNSEDEQSCVLRFNISAFKNNYNLPDLNKMKLTYYGVKVGSCFKSNLSIDKEFVIKKPHKDITAEMIMDIENDNVKEMELDVYDIVLAGVINE